MPSTTKGVPVRTFRDAGTTETFKAGEVYDFESGAFTNYSAAGLVREPDGNEARRTVADPIVSPAADQAPADIEDNQPTG